MQRTLRHWELWSVPRATVAMIFAVEFAAIAVPWMVSAPLTITEFWTAALLASLSIAYSIQTVSSEGARGVLTKRAPASWNSLATWTFAAAVMLPMRLAFAVILIAVVCQWPVKNIDGSARLYRYVYSNAAVLLAAEAANALMTTSYPVIVKLLAAGIAYLLVNLSLVALATISIGKLSDLKFFLDAKTNFNEALTILIGMGQALLWLHHIPLIWLSLPAAIALQRLAMRSDVKRTSDQITKPMSEKIWTMVASEVVKACATTSILRVDTDNPAAANELAQLQAGCDAIGTVGKSGLAILLTDCPGTNADSLAHRLRSAFINGGISAHVVVAAKPRDGQSLDELLAVSEAELITRDAATWSAKSGRPEE